MSKVLIVGDIHLGKGNSLGKPLPGSAINSRIADQIKLLDWVHLQATEKLVDAIILTGDVCEDSRPDYNLINILFSFLSKCQDDRISVHIIAGNHDLRRIGSNYLTYLDLITAARMKDIHIYKDIDTIFLDGIGITLMPFRDRRSLNCTNLSEAVEILKDKLPYEVRSIPPTWDRILIGHLALEGSLSIGDELDDLANEIMCPLDMFVGYDYVWMGHIHKPQIRKKKPYVAHIGSLDLSDYGEVEHQKVLVLYDTQNPNKFNEIPVPSRPLRKFVLEIPSVPDTTQYVCEKLAEFHQKKSIKNAICKIELKLINPESLSVNKAVIDSRFKELGGFHISNFSESRAALVVPLEKQLNISNDIAPKQAVKLWAEKLNLEDSDREEFIELATSILKDLSV